MLISANSGLYSFRAGQPRYLFTDSIRFLAAAGFRAIDINFSAVIYREPDRVEPLLLGDDWRERVEDLDRLIKSLGLHIYMSHLPFFEYADTGDPEREFRFAMTERALEASSVLGVKWAVAHPSNLPDYEAAKRATGEYLDRFLKKAEDLGLGIAIENMPKPAGYFSSGIEALCRLIDERGGGMGFCLDSGHLHVTGPDPAATIRAIGGRLKTLHLHDNFGDKDQHLAPFLGTINWRTYAESLRDCGYEGDLNFEVHPIRQPGVTEKMRELHAAYVFSAGEAVLSMLNDR
jgi:sugar phosphate isomerase/epimerase